MRSFNLSGIGLGLYLIGIGVIFIVHQATGFNAISLWLRLSPILPILLGLDYILSTASGTAANFEKPSGFVTTVIIVITIFGLLFSAIPNWGLHDFQKFKHFGYSHRSPFDWNQGPPLAVNEDFKLPAGVSTIKIDNQFGNIKVDSITGNTLSAKALIRLHGHLNRQERKSFQAKFKLVGEVQGDQFMIHLQKPDPLTEFGQNSSVDININVLRGLSVVIKSSAGNVQVGTVEGNLQVEMAAGNLTVQHIGRDLKLSNKFGNVDIGTILGNADIVTKAGQVKIEKINGNAQVESALGDINLAECHGSVTATIQTGNLRVNLAKISGDSDFDSKMGNIELGLPADAKFSLDANCMMGNIDADFAVAVKKEMASASARGDVNGGGPLIKIREKTGNIRVHKL